MAKRNRGRKQQGESRRNDDFEPIIKGALTLPAEVVRARAEADAEAEELSKILEPRIEGHLIVYQIVLDALIEAHSGIGDTMDFGFQERTRWTAI